MRRPESKRRFDNPGTPVVFAGFAVMDEADLQPY